MYSMHIVDLWTTLDIGLRAYCVFVIGVAPTSQVTIYEHEVLL